MSTTVAYLGPAGTFTEEALRRFESSGAFGGPVTALPLPSPAAALDAVRTGQADAACVAIENSVDGVVTAAIDALSVSGAQIYGEVDVEIEFSILHRPDTTPQLGGQLPAPSAGHSASGRRLTLTTHPVAYQQVKGWVQEHLGEVEFVPASSNGAAAEAVAAGRADIAAAPARAGELFGLQTFAAGVADHAGAKTRFVWAGRPGVSTPRTGNDRTAVVFVTPNRPGTLVQCLSEFAHRGVNLCRIESRPTREVFGTYRFFVDIVGHIEDEPVAEALRALYLRAAELRFLGSWPAVESLEDARVDLSKVAEATDWVRGIREGRR